MATLRVYNQATATWQTIGIVSGAISQDELTDLPITIANGGTGQVTAQAAIDALSAVSGATNEHVLTKDTGTGNAIFKVIDHGSLTGLDTGADHSWIDQDVRSGAGPAFTSPTITTPSIIGPAELPFGTTIFVDDTNTKTVFALAALATTGKVNFLAFVNANEDGSPILAAFAEVGGNSHVDLTLQPRGTGEVVTTGGLNVGANVITSTLTTGTAPMVVASTTVVTNLNADLLDGNEAAAFGLIGSANAWTESQTYGDNDLLTFGAGSDGSISSDGTDLVIEAGGATEDVIVKLGNKDTDLSNTTFFRIENSDGDRMADFNDIGSLYIGPGSRATSQILLGISADGVPARFAAETYSPTQNHNATFTFTKYAGTVASPSAVASGDRLFTISGAGYDGSATVPIVLLRGRVDGTVSSGNVPTEVGLYSGASTSAVALTIDSVGDATFANDVLVSGTLTATAEIDATTNGIDAKTYSTAGVLGATGTFVDNDSNTVTVSSGIITSLS